jgi:cell division protein FtsL
MKVMSREFTTSEKILLVVLAIILFGLLYYRFVYVTTQDMVSSLKAEADTKQSELEISKSKLADLEKKQKEMDAIRASGNDSRMESYNNSKRETAFLNQVLSDVPDYSISFAEVTREGDQIRRSFTLQFKAKNYRQAIGVVKDLTHGEYRCLVDDINYSLTDNNEIYIDLTATFFETMVGGTEDSALPKDETKADDSNLNRVGEDL